MRSKHYDNIPITQISNNTNKKEYTIKKRIVNKHFRINSIDIFDKR